MKAQDYAKALYQLGGKPAHLKGLKEALKRRKQLKLLPRVLSEYQKLELRDRRLTAQKKVTPAEERTRVLLELYRTLIAAPTSNN
jgi:hypothetical protein